MGNLQAGVITFPGSNCDRDIHDVLNGMENISSTLLWHRDPIDKPFDLLVVPGGFSYGDYLRAGAIARFAKAMQSVREHVAAGRPVIGICNGFQILCEAGFLPGALIRNVELKHICKDVELDTPGGNAFTRELDRDKTYTIPVSHSDGNFRADADTIKALQDNNQIAFRYRANPNGSVENIAGVTDKAQKVLGMMPHPERAADALTGGTDGRVLLEAFLKVAA